MDHRTIIPGKFKRAYLAGGSAGRIFSDQLVVNDPAGCQTLKFLGDGTGLYLGKWSLATTVPPDRVADVRSALTGIGVLSADVGRVTDGVGVRITRKEKSIHYRQIRCEEDELARMWTLYPRNE